jgi:hypothetical protein
MNIKRVTVSKFLMFKKIKFSVYLTLVQKWKYAEKHLLFIEKCA